MFSFVPGRLYDFPLNFRYYCLVCPKWSFLIDIFIFYVLGEGWCSYQPSQKPRQMQGEIFTAYLLYDFRIHAVALLRLREWWQSIKWLDYWLGNWVWIFSRNSILSSPVCQNLFSLMSTGHEADHSPSYSAKVENTWSCVCVLFLQCLVHIQALAKFTFNKQTINISHFVIW